MGRTATTAPMNRTPAATTPGMQASQSTARVTHTAPSWQAGLIMFGGQKVEGLSRADHGWAKAKLTKSNATFLRPCQPASVPIPHHNYHHRCLPQAKRALKTNLQIEICSSILPSVERDWDVKEHMKTYK